MTKAARAALYVRVSTDRQTVENQIAKLTDVAQARGWQIVETFNDAGISGAKGRRDRSLARVTDDPFLKEQYQDLAVNFARNAGRERDLDGKQTSYAEPHKEN